MTPAVPYPPPPEPIDPTNPHWVGRAWQWTFDRLAHAETCTDEAKGLAEKALAALERLTTAVENGDRVNADKLKEHRDFHEQMERQAELDQQLQKGKSLTWKLQAAIASKLFKYGTDGTVIVIFLYVLKHILHLV